MTPNTPAELGLSRGLYPLIDADACERLGLDPVDCARAAVEAGPPLLQLRAKNRPASTVQRWAEQIVHFLPQGGPRLVINDRADVAYAVGASGVHVGQDDLPAAQVVRHFPSLLVGLSAHDEAQLEAALGLGGLTYVALGPIFPTTSKENAEPSLSLPRLRAAYELARERGRKLVAIGGITMSRISEVAETCDLVAAISLILPQTPENQPYSWIRKRVATLDHLVKQAR
jgi:thiamine-phosphate pyrophosphorylase